MGANRWNISQLESGTRELSTDINTSSIEPVYLKAYQEGVLNDKIQQGREFLKNCELCPRKCQINHYQELGTVCRTGIRARISSYFPHHGEETCLSGYKGSGTIFFTSCNLRCVFCQNWEISHNLSGQEASPGEIAAMMVCLQDQGCHNINLVTPSHVVVPILESLPLAIERGFRLPLVYNTSAYDSLESLRLLDGIVDIYMPDFKFWDVPCSKHYLNAPDYPEIARRNLMEMHRQVGDLEEDEAGIARRGLMVRHLVMPNRLKDTKRILQFIAREISINTAINVMYQYHPEHKVKKEKYKEINRSPTLNECKQAIHLAREAGLYRFV